MSKICDEHGLFDCGICEQSEENLIDRMVLVKKIEQKDKIIELLLGAVEHYAEDHHIREYGYGQMVMLECEEIDCFDEGENFKNPAQQTLEKYKEMIGE